MADQLISTCYPRLDIVAQFIVSKGAKVIRHGQRTLFEHLVGTASHLIAAGASENIVYAGFCHSVYGTPNFRNKLLCEKDRSELKMVLGPDSEILVWEYSISSANNSVTRIVASCISAGRFDLTSYPSMIQIAIANKLDILDDGLIV